MTRRPPTVLRGSLAKRRPCRGADGSRRHAVVVESDGDWPWGDRGDTGLNVHARDVCGGAQRHHMGPVNAAVLPGSDVDGNGPYRAGRPVMTSGNTGSLTLPVNTRGRAGRAPLSAQRTQCLARVYRQVWRQVAGPLSDQATTLTDDRGGPLPGLDTSLRSPQPAVDRDADQRTDDQDPGARSSDRRGHQHDVAWRERVWTGPGRRDKHSVRCPAFGQDVLPVVARLEIQQMQPVSESAERPVAAGVEEVGLVAD